MSVCLISSQEPFNNIVSNILGRIKDLQQKRVLDDAARRRRQRKALEALEQDNFQDDPHADLKMSKKAPKFEESMDTPGNIFRTDGFYICTRVEILFGHFDSMLIWVFNDHDY